LGQKARQPHASIVQSVFECGFEQRGHKLRERNDYISKDKQGRWFARQRAPDALVGYELNLELAPNVSATFVQPVNRLRAAG
jgi:hypothetical protein